MQRILSLLVFSLILLSSCVGTKKISKESVYFQQLNDSLLRTSTASFQSILQPGDLLYIGVNTTNEASAKVLNQQNFYGGIVASGGSANTNSIGYLVDENGKVRFPYIGQIKVSGMSRNEASDHITQALKPYVSDAIVSVRILNYKITVLGEVTRPGTISVPNERVTILDAIGLAGDLTPFAKRNNIRVIRETNGKRITGEVDLKSGNIFNSPFFYLQQNDVVYVEMNERKMANVDQASVRNVSLALAAVSAIALVINTISNL
jgi:polysaccharide biosynthesis/export protein